MWKYWRLRQNPRWDSPLGYLSFVFEPLGSNLWRPVWAGGYIIKRSRVWMLAFKRASADCSSAVRCETNAVRSTKSAERACAEKEYNRSGCSLQDTGRRNIDARRQNSRWSLSNLERGPGFRFVFFCLWYLPRFFSFCLPQCLFILSRWRLYASKDSWHEFWGLAGEPTCIKTSTRHGAKLSTTWKNIYNVI